MLVVGVVCGLTRAADRAGLNTDGLPRLSFHDLRHTAITHLIRSGADVAQVLRFAGHSKASTALDIYVGEFEGRSSTILDAASQTPPRVALVSRRSDPDLTQTRLEAERSRPRMRKPRMFGVFLMERAGLEPATPSLQSWCSPN
jgi:hypothetical protein